MVIVKISSPSSPDVRVLALEVEDYEVSHKFLIVDGRSEAREYLLNMLDTGYLTGRTDWDRAQITKEFEVKIPPLNLEYILQEVQADPLEQELPQNEEQNKKTMTKWTYRSVLRLIHHWNQRKQRFENNIENNESIWEDLAEAMIAEGLQFSSTQCENKFKYIKRVYIETKDYNRKSTGQPEKTCAFFEELDDLFKQSAQANPLTLVSNRDGASSQTSDLKQLSASSSSSTIPAEEDISPPPVKKSRLDSILTKWADKFEEKSTERETARQKRHEELIQLQKETNELYKSMMTKLLEKL